MLALPINDYWIYIVIAEVLAMPSLKNLVEGNARLRPKSDVLDYLGEKRVVGLHAA